MPSMQIVKQWQGEINPGCAPLHVVVRIDDWLIRVPHKFAQFLPQGFTDLRLGESLRYGVHGGVFQARRTFQK